MANTNTTAKRRVRITPRHGVYFVEYIDRKPRQRYLAAQFAADTRTREQVEQWVSNQPNLTLETSDNSKNYYVLGQAKTTGVLVRCADKDAADYELGLMRYSDCHRIARTTRPTTEVEVLKWLPAGIQLTKRERK